MPVIVLMTHLEAVMTQRAVLTTHPGALMTHPGAVMTHLVELMTHPGALLPLLSFPPADCPSWPGFTTVSGEDHPQDDIRNIGLPEDTNVTTLLATAATQCLQDCSCQAFNTDGWLKRQSGPLVVDRSVCFYVLNAMERAGARAACPPPTPPPPPAPVGQAEPPPPDDDPRQRMGPGEA